MQLSESAQNKQRLWTHTLAPNNSSRALKARGSALRPLSLCTRLGVFRLRRTKARNPANRPVTIALTEKMLAIREKQREDWNTTIYVDTDFAESEVLSRSLVNCRCSSTMREASSSALASGRAVTCCTYFSYCVVAFVVRLL